MDRVSDLLGWIGGAATMYWTLALVAIASVYAASWAVRAASHVMASLMTR